MLRDGDLDPEKMADIFSRTDRPQPRDRHRPMHENQSLCEACSHKKEIVSRRSRFLLCRLSQTDRSFPKYPAQPVLKCDGYAKPEKDDE